MQKLHKHPLPVSIVVAVLIFAAAGYYTEQRHVTWALGGGAISWGLLYFSRRVTTQISGRQPIGEVLTAMQYLPVDSAGLQVLFTEATTNPGAVIADFLLTQEDVGSGVIVGCQEHQNRKWGRRVFSFVLPEELLQTLRGLRANEIRSDLERQLTAGAINLVVAKNRELGDKHQEEDAVRIIAGKALSFEVLIKKGLSSDSIYWGYKTELSGTAPISHIFECKNPKEDSFVHSDEGTPNPQGQPSERVMVRIPIFRANTDLTLFCAPDHFESRMRDLITAKLTGSFDVVTLGGQSTEGQELRQKLGLKVRRYNPPLSTATLRRVGKKGSIRLVGFCVQGKVQEFPEQQFRQELFTTAQMIFSSDPASGAAGRDVDFEEISPLLSGVFNQFPEMSRIVHTRGNFVIEYRPIVENSSIAQYQLRPTQGKTEYFRREFVHGNQSIWQDPNRYRPFPKKTYSKIPSDCYVRTYSGDGMDWVCLHIDIGSPGVNDADVDGQTRSPAVDDSSTLEAALKLFALHEGIKPFHIGDRKAQGFVGEGVDRSGSDVFVKLLEPIHVNRHSTEAVFRDLKKHGCVPSLVEAVRIDDDGRRTAQGTVLVFVTPKYPTAAALIEHPDYAGLQPRLILCLKIAEIAKKIFDANVVCPDWGLGETGIVAAEDENSEDWVFVLDYGSYMKKDQLRRDFHTRKPECEGPENWDASLPFSPEPYMVFGIGLLFYQIVTRTSTNLPESALSQRDASPKPTQAGYEQGLDEDLAGLGAAPIAVLVHEMLGWNPDARPKLQEIITRLNQQIDELVGI